MEPAGLKAAYGQRIVFHGGLDTQEVLPSNDMAQIDAAVEGLLRIMRPRTDGGYVFAAAHNLQRDVTAAAISRMYRTALAVQTPAGSTAAKAAPASPTTPVSPV